MGIGRMGRGVVKRTENMKEDKCRVRKYSTEREKGREVAEWNAGEEWEGIR